MSRVHLCLTLQINQSINQTINMTIYSRKPDHLPRHRPLREARPLDRPHRRPLRPLPRRLRLLGLQRLRAVGALDHPRVHHEEEDEDLELEGRVLGLQGSRFLVQSRLN